ncbi:methyltransferase domain-containing protein [Hymenobacter sp. IS2118]|uniref:methyltransferase domain-containing protein n=1 Tax=Hymenobacter sp. IS2118 TaxID=1505605 RepID=UPI00068E9A79|nr:methyltransferase domain-containing protein [Hymenobacter sp. IS2118]
MKQHLERAIRVSRRLLDNYVGIRESEESIIADSQAYWNRLSNQGRDGGPAHFRGQSIFEQDERWLSIGYNNLRILHRFLGPDWLTATPRRVVDWGCGGGTNAVHFGPGARSYYGVEITQASLDECGRQMQDVGLENFRPVLFDAAQPERVATLIPEPCDLIISTYVFCVFPSKNYALRVLRTMHAILEEAGCALIQIKYCTHQLNSRSYHWGYAKNMGNMTTFFIEEFWTLATECGLEPQLLYLEPHQPLNGDNHFAYFLLKKAAPEKAAPLAARAG